MNNFFKNQTTGKSTQWYGEVDTKKTTSKKCGSLRHPETGDHVEVANYAADGDANCLGPGVMERRHLGFEIPPHGTRSPGKAGLLRWYCVREMRICTVTGWGVGRGLGSPPCGHPRSHSPNGVSPAKEINILALDFRAVPDMPVFWLLRWAPGIVRWVPGGLGALPDGRDRSRCCSKTPHRAHHNLQAAGAHDSLRSIMCPNGLGVVARP